MAWTRRKRKKKCRERDTHKTRDKTEAKHPSVVVRVCHCCLYPHSRFCFHDETNQNSPSPLPPPPCSIRATTLPLPSPSRPPSDSRQEEEWMAWPDPQSGLTPQGLTFCVCKYCIQLVEPSRRPSDGNTKPTKIETRSRLVGRVPVVPYPTTQGRSVVYWDVLLPSSSEPRTMARWISPWSTLGSCATESVCRCTKRHTEKATHAAAK